MEVTTTTGNIVMKHTYWNLDLTLLKSNIFVPEHVNKLSLVNWILSKMLFKKKTEQEQRQTTSVQDSNSGPVLRTHRDSCRQPSPCVDAPADSSVWWRWSMAGYHGDRRCEAPCPRCRPPAWGRSRIPGGADIRPLGLLLLLSGEESGIGGSEEKTGELLSQQTFYLLLMWWQAHWNAFIFISATSLRSFSDAALSYLSLVVLCVEEVCVPGQLYHRSDVVLGLVDDGQVEQPVQTVRG